MPKPKTCAECPVHKIKDHKIVCGVSPDRNTTIEECPLQWKAD